MPQSLRIDSQPTLVSIGSARLDLMQKKLFLQLKCHATNIYWSP